MIYNKSTVKLPIKIEKILIPVNDGATSYPSDYVQGTIGVERYIVTIEEKGSQWEKSIICNRDSLLQMKLLIEFLTEPTSTANILGISEDQGKIVDEHHANDTICKNCIYKLKHNCVECLFVLQSPLERKLYLELLNNYIKFQIQYALNWRGQHISINDKTYGDPINNFKEVLTVVDFYIEKGTTKLCLYTDGHSYHERTEEQAQHDRNIDRKVQELGFKAIRYTGKDVNEGIQKIIDDIKKWTE